MESKSREAILQSYGISIPKDYDGKRALFAAMDEWAQQPPKVEDEAKPGLKDFPSELSALTKEERHKFIADIMKPCAEVLLRTFFACGLKTHMEQMIIEENSKKEFVLSFRPLPEHMKTFTVPEPILEDEGLEEWIKVEAEKAYPQHPMKKSPAYVDTWFQDKRDAFTKGAKSMLPTIEQLRKEVSELKKETVNLLKRISDYQDKILALIQENESLKAEKEEQDKQIFEYRCLLRDKIEGFE